MGLTDQRVQRFCRDLHALAETKVGFADVGSGGDLKGEWRRFDPDRVEYFAVDPECWEDPTKTPLCISNEPGRREFHVAVEPRGSSLHPVDPAFCRRFGFEWLKEARSIEVDAITLDDFLGEKRTLVDVVDINIEGHDFQALSSGERLFAEAFVKAVKMEFEMAGVWQGQGWFADIDAWLRARGYELVKLDVTTCRPLTARRIHHPGEPIWGKAYYLPTSGLWRERLDAMPAERREEALIKGVLCAAVVGAPGRAVELLRDTCPELPLQRLDPDRCRKELYAACRFSELEGHLAAATRAMGRLLWGLPYYLRCATRRSLGD